MARAKLKFVFRNMRPVLYEESEEYSDVHEGKEDYNISMEEQLKYLAFAESILETKGQLGDDCMKAILQCQRDLMIVKRQGL